MYLVQWLPNINYNIPRLTFRSIGFFKDFKFSRFEIVPFGTIFGTISGTIFGYFSTFFGDFRSIKTFIFHHLATNEVEGYNLIFINHNRHGIPKITHIIRRDFCAFHFDTIPSQNFGGCWLAGIALVWILKSDCIREHAVVERRFACNQFCLENPTSAAALDCFHTALIRRIVVKHLRSGLSLLNPVTTFMTGTCWRTCAYEELSD